MADCAARGRAAESDRARLVAPVQEGEQRLVVIERTAAGFERRTLERVRFVPLIS